MSRLQFKLEENGETKTLVLSGQIDESFPTELHSIEGGKNLTINLEQIKMINSLGIREWIKFINSIKAESIEFINCPKIFIDQVNMVQGFISAHCKIKSFYVPYFNEDSNMEKNVLYTFGVDYGVDFLNTKSSITAADGSELEIDVVEQKYFKFLKA